MAEWQIAPVNVATAVYPLEDAGMAEFMGLLDAVNALAEASPGFVWRLDPIGAMPLICGRRFPTGEQGLARLHHLDRHGPTVSPSPSSRNSRRRDLRRCPRTCSPSPIASAGVGS